MASVRRAPPPRAPPASLNVAPHLPPPAQTSFVWVLHVSDPPLLGLDFCKVQLAGCTHVADVSEGACAKFKRWEVAANEVELVLAAESGDDAPTAEAIAAALSRPRVQASLKLESAGIVAGSWLLARVPQQHAAAAGSGPGLNFEAALSSAMAGLEARLESRLVQLATSRKNSRGISAEATPAGFY